jgi:hypothetical protein
VGSIDPRERELLFCLFPPFRFGRRLNFSWRPIHLDSIIDPELRTSPRPPNYYASTSLRAASPCIVNTPASINYRPLRSPSSVLHDDWPRSITVWVSCEVSSPPFLQGNLPSIFVAATMGVCSSCLGKTRDRDLSEEVSHWSCFRMMAPKTDVAPCRTNNRGCSSTIPMQVIMAASATTMLELYKQIHRNCSERPRRCRRL